MKQDYVGLARDVAVSQALLGDGVAKVRVATVDGKPVAKKTKADPTRLNLHVENGIVTGQDYG